MLFSHVSYWKGPALLSLLVDLNEESHDSQTVLLGESLGDSSVLGVPMHKMHLSWEAEEKHWM